MRYRKAAYQGQARAQLSLGGMYYEGRGVVQRYIEALVWCRKAAAQRQANAQFNLRELYRDGLGVPKSTARALSWYRKAATQEDELAMERVAEPEAD